jgi:acetolactate synthase-1/2/3 large subunit
MTNLTLDIEEQIIIKAKPATPPSTVEEKISGSKAVLEAFIAEDVTTIFGYPGGAIMPIYDALFRRSKHWEKR